MVEYNKVNDKLSNTQLKKIKTAVKNKTGTTLRINLKMFNGNNLPHELLLTARQKSKLRNAFNNNISTDLKLSKAQISKINQFGGFLGSLLNKLIGPLMKIAIPLAKNVLAPFGITAAASSIDAGIKKKNTSFWKYDFNNFKWRNERYNKNYSSSWNYSKNEKDDF